MIVIKVANGDDLKDSVGGDDDFVALVVTMVLMIVFKVAMTLMIVLVVTITLMIAIKVAMILMIIDCGDDEYMKIAIKVVSP